MSCRSQPLGFPEAVALLMLFHSQVFLLAFLPLTLGVRSTPSDAEIAASVDRAVTLFLATCRAEAPVPGRAAIANE